MARSDRSQARIAQSARELPPDLPSWLSSCHPSCPAVHANFQLSWVAVCMVERSHDTHRSWLETPQRCVAQGALCHRQPSTMMAPPPKNAPSPYTTLSPTHPLIHHPPSPKLVPKLSLSDRGKLQVPFLDPGLVGPPGMACGHTRADGLLEFHIARASLIPIARSTPLPDPAKGGFTR